MFPKISFTFFVKGGLNAQTGGFPRITGKFLLILSSLNRSMSTGKGWLTWLLGLENKRYENQTHPVLGNYLQKN